MYYGNTIPQCCDDDLESPDSPDGNYSQNGNWTNCVVLIAEDGEYTKFAGTWNECVDWIDENEQFYGEGQELIIE